LTLPKELQQSLGIGEGVLVINAGDHLKLIPLPSDPLGVLHGAFNVDRPFGELRAQAESLAEAGGDARRGAGCRSSRTT